VAARIGNGVFVVVAAAQVGPDARMVRAAAKALTLEPDPKHRRTMVHASTRLDFDTAVALACTGWAEASLPGRDALVEVLDHPSKLSVEVPDFGPEKWGDPSPWGAKTPAQVDEAQRSMRATLKCAAPLLSAHLEDAWSARPRGASEREAAARAMTVLARLELDQRERDRLVALAAGGSNDDLLPTLLERLGVAMLGPGATLRAATGRVYAETKSHATRLALIDWVDEDGASKGIGFRAFACDVFAASRASERVELVLAAQGKPADPCFRGALMRAFEAVAEVGLANRAPGALVDARDRDYWAGLTAHALVALGEPDPRVVAWAERTPVGIEGLDFAKLGRDAGRIRRSMERAGRGP